MSRQNAILRTVGLTRRFGGLVAINNVELTVREGEIQGLIGPNGSGKTTLFNLVSGVLHPNEGEVLFEEKPVTKLPTHARTGLGIGRTFQLLRLFRQMTVLENVMVGYHRRMGATFWEALASPAYSRKEVVCEEVCRGLLDLVGLKGKENEVSTALPYGQQRLLEIARALAARPKLLLLDEPMAGMNTAEKEEVMAIIRKIREQGITVILIEHAVRAVMSVADRITVLNFGKKIAEGTPDEIRNNQEVINAYLGTRH